MEDRPGSQSEGRTEMNLSQEECSASDGSCDADVSTGWTYSQIIDESNCVPDPPKAFGYRKFADFWPATVCTSYPQPAVLLVDSGVNPDNPFLTNGDTRVCQDNLGLGTLMDNAGQELCDPEDWEDPLGRGTAMACVVSSVFQGRPGGVAIWSKRVLTDTGEVDYDKLKVLLPRLLKVGLDIVVLPIDLDSWEGEGLCVLAHRLAQECIVLCAAWPSSPRPNGRPTLRPWTAVARCRYGPIHVGGHDVEGRTEVPSCNPDFTLLDRGWVLHHRPLPRDDDALVEMTYARSSSTALAAAAALVAVYIVVGRQRRSAFRCNTAHVRLLLLKVCACPYETCWMPRPLPGRQPEDVCRALQPSRLLALLQPETLL